MRRDRLENSLLEDRYFFLSHQPQYPGFQETPCSFPLELPPGYFVQNVPVISYPLMNLATLSEHYTWSWYTVLLDPLTSELIDYSMDQFGDIDSVAFSFD